MVVDMAPEIQRLDQWLKRLWWWFYHGKEEVRDVEVLEWSKEDEEWIEEWDLELRVRQRRERDEDTMRELMGEAMMSGALSVVVGTRVSARHC